MISSGLLTTAMLGGGHIASLFFLFRWFSNSDASHVLPIGDDPPTRRAAGRFTLRAGFRVALVAGIATALLAIEANALAAIGSWVPGVICGGNWLPTLDCRLEAASSQLGREVALAILVGCAVTMFAARHLMSSSVLYLPALLMIGIIGFGAAADIIAGGEAAARPELLFRIIAGLQLTAAAGFALSAVILPLRSVTAAIRCLLAHMAGASVRILGAISILALWPNLPAASAIALVVTMLLVPGVASALTAAAALATSTGCD